MEDRMKAERTAEIAAAAAALLLTAAPASANPGYAPAAGVLFLLVLPITTVLLSTWGGAYAILRAKGRKPWGPLGRGIFMLALLWAGSLFLPSWLLCFLIVCFHAVIRGIRMLIWAKGALKPPESRVPFLADARPWRLVSAGIACPASVPLMFLLARYIFGGSFGMESAAMLGNMGSIRSALSIYYGDMDRQYPAELSALAVGGKYLSTLPPAQPSVVHWPGNTEWPLHRPSNAVRYGNVSDDSGGWLYDNVVGDTTNYGSVWVNCTHTDRRGTVWSAY